MLPHLQVNRTNCHLISNLFNENISGHISNPQHHWEPHTSFAEAEVYFKKELPGRTMEFTYDLSQTPVIERRHKRTGLPSFSGYDKEDIKENATSPRRSLSLSTADSATFSGWKRPWMSQVRMSGVEIYLVPALFSRAVCENVWSIF